VPLQDGYSRDDAKSYNRRARQLFWRGAVPADCPVWNLNDDAVVDWVADYQTKNDLLPDGKLGVSTMIVMMAEKRGGLGDIIIDGKELHIDGFRVARMFSPDSSAASVSPDICCVLAQPEMDRAVRERLEGASPLRSHFSIDSSFGTHSESLVIQWADPLRAVPFCPPKATGDYPVMRQCIGIEFENALLGFQLDNDERRWDRRRDYVKGQLGTSQIRQPELYNEQITAFAHLRDILVNHCGIKNIFPTDSDGVYLTKELTCQQLADFHGFAAKFNYAQQNNEPGVGFVVHLDKLFKAAEPQKAPEAPVTEQIQEQSQNVQVKSEENPKTPENDTVLEEKSKFDPKPTQSFSPHMEEDPRFSLSAAIAAAWQSGKAARGARMAERTRHFDAD